MKTIYVSSAAITADVKVDSADLATPQQSGLGLLSYAPYMRVGTFDRISIDTSASPIAASSQFVSPSDNQLPGNQTCTVYVSTASSSVNLTIRPQLIANEMSTRRLNRALTLGYLPPLRHTSTDRS